MEFTVSSSVLMRTVNTLSGIISSNSALPILDNLLFEQKNGRLTISASDMETTMTSTIDVDGQSSGKIAVPAKMLAEILKTFPELPLTFVAREQEHLLKINYGTTDNEGNCDLPYEDADTAQAWAKNLESGGYVRFDENPRAYWDQPVEADARRFASDRLSQLRSERTAIAERDAAREAAREASALSCL